jgi:phosphonate transport system substrate-binding protein
VDRNKFGAELLVAPQVNGSVRYESYIIVHKDSKIRSLDQLKGKTFAFTDPKSNSGRLYPVYRLAQKKSSPEEFFKKYIYSYSHNKSIELIAKKIVDGAAVESLIYRYMEEQGSPYVKQTRVINISPSFGIPPMVTTPSVPVTLKKKMQEILVSMHDDSAGRDILQSMLIDKFLVVPDSNYNSIRQMHEFVSIHDISDDLAVPEKEIIYFGVLPRDNPRIAYEKYQPIIDFLSDSTQYTFELSMRKTYDDIVDALGRGEVDLAFLGPLTYLIAHKEYGAASIVRSITDKNETFYRSVIITRANHSVKRVGDLEGKKFAFAAMESTAGNLVPRWALAVEGIHLKELHSYNNFNSHDSVIKWVLKGQYDGGAVRESIAKKYEPMGVRVLLKSGPIPTGPVVVGPKTPYTIAETVKHNLLDLNKTEYGREVLEKTDPELQGGFIEAQDADYEHIRQLINKVPITCGRGCHPKIRL